MNDRLSRRDALKRASALALAGARLSPEWSRPATPAPLRLGGRDVAIEITSVSARTVRLRMLPVSPPTLAPAADGALVRQEWGPPAARLTGLSATRRVTAGALSVTVSPNPLTIVVEGPNGRGVQRLTIDDGTGAVTFALGDGPVLGLGEGGPQFDRRGAADPMRSGQGGYRLRTHGGRVPIPWLIGTSGWAMLIHAPSGSFDLTGTEGRFSPARALEALPLDVFVVAVREPAEAMAEYARLTGFPEMPPLWAFGYQQSHRTITSPEDILAIARTFREKRLPCDALIYLGTGFAPSGWNVQNGSFAFHPAVFPDPPALLAQMHAMHYRIVLHAVINART
jgi:alpha-glucosidase/alpha-D-xyloside xylohydrolase